MDLKNWKSTSDLKKIVVSWQAITTVVRLYRSWKKVKAQEPRVGEICSFSDERFPGAWAVGRLASRQIDSEGMIIYQVCRSGLIGCETPGPVDQFWFRECEPVSERKGRRIARRRSK